MVLFTENTLVWNEFNQCWFGMLARPPDRISKQKGGKWFEHRFSNCFWECDPLNANTGSIINRLSEDSFKRHCGKLLHCAAHQYTPVVWINGTTVPVLYQWVFVAWDKISSDSVLHLKQPRWKWRWCVLEKMNWVTPNLALEKKNTLVNKIV